MPEREVGGGSGLRRPAPLLTVGTGAAWPRHLQAVVQVNGTFLQQLVQIESAVITRLGTNGVESQAVDHFEERIEQSTAGVIRSFEIIDRTRSTGFEADGAGRGVRRPTDRT